MTAHVLTPRVVDITLPRFARKPRIRTIRVRPESHLYPKDDLIDMTWALYRLAPRV